MRSSTTILCVLLVFFSYGQSIDVVELKQPKSNKVIIKLMFRNGSISDPINRSGLTNLTANLMTQGGTKDYSFDEIQKLIYPMAAQYEVLVDKEISTFTFSVHRDFFNEFYPIVKSVILSPDFNESDFNRIKSNQKAYVDQIIRASSDEEYSKKLLENLIFRGTNYQYPVQGNSMSIDSVTIDDVRNHYTRIFNQQNLTVGIAGNYTREHLNTLISDLNSLPSTVLDLIKPGTARIPNGMEIEIISKKGAFGSAIFMGFPLSITRSDKDFAALMVANSFLGEHRKSYGRLYQKIRESRSINYGNYSYIEWYHAGGSNQLPPSGVSRSSNYFSIWIRPVQIGKQLKSQYKELSEIKIGHAHFTMRMAIRELGLLIKNGMTQNQFESTREFLRSYVKLYIQSPEDQLGFLLDSKFYGRKDYISELDVDLKILTVHDVNRVIKKYLQIDNMFVAIVTDESEVKPLSKSLENNNISPMYYSLQVKSGLSPEILNEDEEVEKFPLNIKSLKIIDSSETLK